MARGFNGNAYSPQSRSSSKDNIELQRRHYEFLAETLSRFTYGTDDDHARLVEHFACALSGTNSNYSSSAFIAYATRK